MCRKTLEAEMDMSHPNAKKFNALQWLPLSELEWSAAADAFNLCYSGYVVPVSMGAEDLRLRAAAETIDRDQSYVIYEFGLPAGMAFVSRRGTASRLAAFGVVPACRRSGLGRGILDRVIAAAATRRDSTMELEVIESNLAAANLYQAVGFRTMDSLLGFELKTRPVLGAAPLREEGVDRIRAAIAADNPNPLPWQLSVESLQQLGTGWTVVSVDDGARGIVNLSREDSVLLRLLHTPQQMRSSGSARRLIEALVVEASGRPIRVPQLIPARYERFAHRVGFETTALRQKRMLLDFRELGGSPDYANVNAALRPPRPGYA